jgi:hypothetical protein
VRDKRLEVQPGLLSQSYSGQSYDDTTANSATNTHDYGRRSASAAKDHGSFQLLGPRPAAVSKPVAVTLQCPAVPLETIATCLRV